MKTKVRCCYNCPDRQVGCHGRCPRYQAERKKLDEEIERRAAYCRDFYGACDSRIVRVRKYKREQ